MTGRTRVKGWSRAFASLALPGTIFSAVACGPQISDSGLFGRDPGADVAGGTAGSAGAGTSGKAGASTGGAAGAVVSGGFAGGAATCPQLPAVADSVFREQVFRSASPARRELFMWLTDEQAVALRQSHVLFPEGKAAKTSYRSLSDELAEHAQGSLELEDTQFAILLGDAGFVSGQDAWPEPWPIRLREASDGHARQLVSVVLKQDAWVVVVTALGFVVVDQQNQDVSLAEAIRSPQRVGAVFYQDMGFAAQGCVGPATDPVGFRQFALGNPEMVEQWSIATDEALLRLNQNIDDLSRFMERVRVCPVSIDDFSWSSMVSCGWGDFEQPPYSEYLAYEQSLATASASYVASPARLAALIETLQADLFELDPLVVNAGSP